MQPVGGLSPVVHYVDGGRPIIDDYFDARDFRGLVYLPTVVPAMPDEFGPQHLRDKLADAGYSGHGFLLEQACSLGFQRPCCVNVQV